MQRKRSTTSRRKSTTVSRRKKLTTQRAKRRKIVVAIGLAKARQKRKKVPRKSSR